MQWGDQKCDVFKTAKSVVKINQNIIDELCIRNDDRVPAVIDENMKVDQKSYHVKLLNTLFAWDEGSLSHSDTVGNIAHLIDKDMARKIISKVNNGKVVELSVVSEMVKTAGEAKVDIYCGLTGNLQMLLICTFCCPNAFLGVPKDWSRLFTGFLI